MITFGISIKCIVSTLRFQSGSAVVCLVTANRILRIKRIRIKIFFH